MAALRILVAKGPATLPRLSEIGIDPLVLVFTLAVSLLAGLLFGLIPVLKYAGPQLAAALRGGGRTLSQSRERHRARNTLVVVQVALALVLLIGSGLMIRTFQAMRNSPAGIHAAGRSPVAAHFDSGSPGEGAGTGDAHAERDAGQAGGDSRCRHRSRSPTRSAGRDSTRAIVLYAEDKALCVRGRFPHPAIPVRLAGIFQDHRARR